MAACLPCSCKLALRSNAGRRGAPCIAAYPFARRQACGRRRFWRLLGGVAAEAALAAERRGCCSRSISTYRICRLWRRRRRAPLPSRARSSGVGAALWRYLRYVACGSARLKKQTGAAAREGARQRSACSSNNRRGRWRRRSWRRKATPALRSRGMRGYPWWAFIASRWRKEGETAAQRNGGAGIRLHLLRRRMAWRAVQQHSISTAVWRVAISSSGEKKAEAASPVCWRKLS